MKKISSVRSLCYLIALVAIFGGCIAAVIKKQAVSELFGSATFVFLGAGILIDVITGLIAKPDLQ